MKKGSIIRLNLRMQAMNMENILAHVPKPNSGDYLARSIAAKRRGYNLRKRILSFVLDFFRSFDVFATTAAFVKKIYKVDLDLKVKQVFLLYYSVDTESRSFPWHVDSALATIVITMPSPAFSTNSDLSLELIDPLFLKEKAFLGVVDDKEKFSSFCGSLKEKGEGFFRFKLDVFDMVIMANPVPHRVSSITEGDRISIVTFIA